MSEHNITVTGGSSVRLPTAGKYCDRDILVTALTGGVEIPEGDFSDPEYVYAVTRPKDWLPMPMPGDDEIYLLGHIPEGVDGAFTAQIRHGGNCTVEFGNVVNGVFTAKESIKPTSNTRFYHTLYTSDYGDVTEDGFYQYLVRIKGDFTSALMYPGSDIVYSYGVPMIVDAIIGKDAYNTFGINTTPRQNCEHLRYARFVGGGGHGGFAAFRYCDKLISVFMEKKSTVSSMNYFFDACTSLVAVSENVFSNNASYNNTFDGAKVLSWLNKLELTIGSNANGAFRYAMTMGFIDFEKIDTSQCTDFTYFIYNSNLRKVLNLNISSATVVSSMFGRCFLTQLTFAGETTPGGWTMDLTSCIMSHKALVEMINSLPTATAAATITITGNPGAVELTDDEIAIATAKNWTVTI